MFPVSDSATLAGLSLPSALSARLFSILLTGARS
jgi:hypothetical protein